MDMVEQLMEKYNPWWISRKEPPGVLRTSHLKDLSTLLEKRRMVIVYGLRRCGKSTLLKQFACIKSAEMDPLHIFYISLDHPALKGLSITDIIDRYRALHRIGRDERCYILLDEVQVVPEFEKELKAVYDLEENLYFVGSGSNSLLVRHRSGALSGRHGRIHLRSMDFREFMTFMNYDPKPSEAYLIENYLREYIETGGIPEYVLNRDPHYLEDLVEDVIYKDILPRYGIRNPGLLMDLFYLLCQRAGQRMTPSKLARILNINPDTVSSYISYLEETFLIELVEKEGTPNERKYSPKKVYINDPGILTIIGSNVPFGSRVENLVYLTLNKDRADITYLDAGGKEIDFLIDGTAYEVKYKDRLDENDIYPIMGIRSSKIARKVLITKNKDPIEGIEVRSVLDLVIGR